MSVIIMFYLIFNISIILQIIIGIKDNKIKSFQILTE